MTTIIAQDYAIATPPDKVYQVLMDASVMQLWGAEPVVSNARKDGTFSLWAGDIHGTSTKLVPSTLIEQDWCGHDNPSWKYNVSFAFEPTLACTIVHITYSGNILDEQKDIADWHEYYFEPIKKLPEQ